MALVSAMLFGIFTRFTTDKAIIWTFEAVAVLSTGVAASCLGNSVVEGFGIANTLVSPLVIGLPLTVVYAVMGQRAREAGSLFRTTSAITLFVTGAVELISGGSVESALIALVIGILGLTYACINELKGTLIAGGALALISLMRVCALAITSISVSPWVLLGVIGVATILGASYLERNFVRIRESVYSMRRHVAAWN
jgi:hypothetical protein